MLDILEAAQMPFVVLGQIAYQMKHNEELDAPKAVFAVMDQYNIRELTSMLPIIEPKLEKLSDGYKLSYKNFPVIIRFLTRNYRTLVDPDRIYYKYDAWPIPNPFDEYWNGDHLDV